MPNKPIAWRLADLAVERPKSDPDTLRRLAIRDELVRVVGIADPNILEIP